MHRMYNRMCKQNLKVNETEVPKKVIFIWKKDEIAWNYCTTVYSIRKVRFTGKHWLVGDKWNYTKIYQFEILSDSGSSLPFLRLTHDSEDSFFETLESAKEHAIRHINNLMEFQIKTLKKSMNNILEYCAKESTYSDKK